MATQCNTTMKIGAMKKGDPVKLPYYYTGTDVVQIIVETVNDVTGLVEQVIIIREDGKTEVLEVANIVVVSVNIIYRIIAWFDRLFRKR